MICHFTIVTFQKAALNLVRGDSHQINVTVMVVLLRGNIFNNVQNPEKVNFSFKRPVTNFVSCSCHLPSTQQSNFSYWLYIPEWDLTSSMSFHHSSLNCALILQFLHPTRVMSSCHTTSTSFCLSLSPFPPGFVQRTFFTDPFLNTFQVPINKSFG